MTHEPKILQKGGVQTQSCLNIRDAIRLNDEARIRNGSPGSTGKLGSNPGKKSLVKSVTTAMLHSTIESKRSFEEEMEEKGLIHDI
jgi:hypothetical protein